MQGRIAGLTRRAHVAAQRHSRGDRLAYPLGFASGAFWLWTAGFLTTFVRNGFEMNDRFTWVKGKHSIQMGGEAQNYTVTIRNQFRRAGQPEARCHRRALCGYLPG